jgi:hypothetical protein
MLISTLTRTRWCNDTSITLYNNPRTPFYCTHGGDFPKGIENLKYVTTNSKWRVLIRHQTLPIAS